MIGLKEDLLECQRLIGSDRAMTSANENELRAFLNRMVEKHGFVGQYTPLPMVAYQSVRDAYGKRDAMAFIDFAKERL